MNDYVELGTRALSELQEIVYTIGGSHRKYKNDTDKLARNGIPFRWLGPVSLGSKRSHIGVPGKYAEQMESLGYKKAQFQMKHIKQETPADSTPTPEKWDRAATLPERDAITAALDSIGVKSLGVIWNKLDREFMVTNDESLKARLLKMTTLLPQYTITSFHVSRKDVIWLRFDLINQE